MLGFFLSHWIACIDKRGTYKHIWGRKWDRSAINETGNACFMRASAGVVWWVSAYPGFSACVVLRNDGYDSDMDICHFMFLLPSFYWTMHLFDVHEIYSPPFPVSNRRNTIGQWICMPKTPDGNVISQNSFDRANFTKRAQENESRPRCEHSLKV